MADPIVYMQHAGITGSWPALSSQFYALYQPAGWTLDPDQIQDVAPVRNIDIVGSLSDGQAPVWDAASQHFKPGTPGAGTYAPAVPGTGTLTYDTSGNVLTDTDGNTYTWNSDGTLHTQAKGGVTRTFTWNADGTLASVA